MFTTFSLPSTSTSTSASESPNDPLAPPKPRPKRQQVNRACAWCRAHRIKCDASQPCGNCRAKGRKCTSEEGSGSERVRTFPGAIKEIDRLQARVKELEDQVRSLKINPNGGADEAEETESPISKEGDTLPEELDPLSQHGSNKTYYNWDFAVKETKPGSNQTYGLSSNFYFTDRLARFLQATLHQRQYVSFNSTPEADFSYSRALCTVMAPSDTMDLDRTIVGHDLPRAEEEALLQLYWKSWHPLYPIIDKEAFELHYTSLWTSADTRVASALVDIMVALCLQLDAAQQASSSAEEDPIDSTTGWWAYRRCTHFLQFELEEPSVRTYQCHFLAALWLSKANWHNAAHNMLAAALRIGVILGLHTEPCRDLHPRLREFRRRLWWIVYAKDAHYAMEFGRPLGVHFSQVNCTLPKAIPSSTSSDLSPTMYSDQLIRLVLAARAIYVMFYRVCAKVVRQNGLASLTGDIRSLETCAEWLDANMSYLSSWMEQVPESLKTPREYPGKPYATDRSRLILRSTVDKFSRSRLILELLYHQVAMALCRPFITFRSDRKEATPSTDRHAISCVSHAITMTDIIADDLKRAGNLKAWQTVCCWQWNAALVLIGYALAYPEGSVTRTVRKTLDTALDSFGALSHTFIVARNVVQVLAKVVRQVDSIVLHNDEDGVVSPEFTPNTPGLASLSSTPNLTEKVQHPGASWNDTNSIMDWTAFGLPSLTASADGTLAENWTDFLDFGPTGS